MKQSSVNWNATAFVLRLTSTNKFAKEKALTFAKVSGLDGFEEALSQIQSATAIIAV